MVVVTGLFRDERGMTSAGVAISLLLVLALVFGSAQVYRINSLSSEVQNVADAAALAAENVVAEFMIVVRVCDAVVLSLTLASAVVTGAGVVALCVPAAQAAGETLIETGKDIATARDEFAQRAASGLNSLQQALPYLAAANAAAVAAANDRDTSSYVALSILSPSEGTEIAVGADTGLSEAQEAVDEQAGDIEEAASAAEEAALAAEEAKQTAFEHDCGLNPGYCLYERADALASLSAADNPLYTSVDAWSFSVALSRAQAYYAARLAQEEPEDDSVEEQVRSALRTRLYAYAVELLAQGYVHETEDSFEAYFPTLPQNTSQMRETSLYTELAYPVTEDEEGRCTMHAWDGCPAIEGQTTLGSIQQMEEGGYDTCAQCGFTAASLGKVAAASSSIQNGFEYHYRIVAEAAEDYEQAREELDPLASEVKELAEGLFAQLKEVIAGAAVLRIEAEPPGSDGAVVLVANVGQSAASEGFESGFVQSSGTLGVRVAISAATLLEEPAGEGGSVVSSLADGLADEAGVASGMAGAVLECWSALLGAYADGEDALLAGLESVIDSIPLASTAGLGGWAAEKLEEVLADAGLEPAELDALKPVLVNTAHVSAAEDDEDSFAARLLGLKKQAIAGSDVDGLVGTLLDAAGGSFLGDIASTGSVHVATIELYDGGPSASIDLALPEAVSEAASTVLDDALDALGAITSTITGVGIWE